MLRCALVGLALAGCSSSAGAPPVIDAPDGYAGPVSLTVLNHATATTVVSSPAGIDCPRTCTAEFPIHSSVTLSFDTHANYLVALYSEPCVRDDSDNFSCRVTLRGSTTIEADGGQE